MRNVLILDDEADMRDAIGRVLGRAGIAVRTIVDPTDAMTELTRLPADLVITDIIMPKVNGVDVIDSILKELPAMRILAISGGGNFDTASHPSGEMVTTTYLPAARNAGEHHILTKPFDSGELLQAVELAMGADPR